jgi:hypothetical protein
LEISTKETNEIQQKNGRWYDKKRPDRSKKISEEREPKGSSTQKDANGVNEKI